MIYSLAAHAVGILALCLCRFHGGLCQFVHAVHFYRNVFTAVPSGKVREVASMLKAIHAQEGRPAAEEKARAVAAKLREMKGPPPLGLHLLTGANTPAKFENYVQAVTAHQIELKSFNPAYPDRTFLLNEIAFVHRIIWASQ